MKNPFLAIFLFVVLALLLVELSRADNATPVTRMDLFITADRTSKRLDTFAVKHPEITLRVHTLDSIEKFEDALSKGLPRDPREAKRVALSRLKQLSKNKRAELEHAATSIATALAYGVMKYPAIVFNSEFVAYGLRDPLLALEHFQRWHRAKTS
ncbi:MAG: TIGR03757 family integrating conjugative element protein [Proteobacteria bacterium]|nr:TIGR03757 family integrating conjugative element protein [Pseudomonadota bacterium]